jgi:ADP-ribosylglycohydrolase
VSAKVARFWSAVDNQDIPGAAAFIADLCSLTHQTTVAVSAGLAHAFGLAYCLDADPATFNAAEFVEVVVNASRIGRDYFPETLNEDDITERLALCHDYALWSPERCMAEFENGRCYVYCSLPFSYMIFLRNPTSIESLYDVVNATLDRDTTGSMTGALLGALNGTSIFPAHLVNELEAKDQLVEVGHRLCDVLKIE